MIDAVVPAKAGPIRRALAIDCGAWVPVSLTVARDDGRRSHRYKDDRTHNSPFRADHVGSLLRTAPLKEARARREKNEISAAELKEAEDRAISAIISRQEDIGLRAVTDGEFRRAFWNYDFLGDSRGSKPISANARSSFRARNPKPMMLRVTGKLGTFSGHPMLEHFKYVKEHTRAAPKMTIPSPSSLHFRYGRDAVPESIYPDMDEFYRDLGQTLSQGRARFRRRRLPLSAARRGQLRLSLRSEAARAGRQTAATIRYSCRAIYAGMINAAMSDIPADMTIAMHLCRGNFQSTFVASGGYEPVAEILFNTHQRARLFHGIRQRPRRRFRAAALRAQGQDRRARPRHHQDRHAARSRTTIKRRIDEAAKFVPLEQLCLSPQCGFASTEEGNILAEDEQWAKLRMIVEVAEEVWG